MEHAYYQYGHHGPDKGDIKSFFPFSLPCSYHLHSIDWTDDCITGNGGKSTAHVVPALIRVCWFSVSLSVWFHVQLFPFCPPGKISTTSTSDDQRSKRIRFIQVMVHFYLCVCVFKSLISLHNLTNAHFRLKSLWVGAERCVRSSQRLGFRFSDVVCPLRRLHNYESHDCTIVNRFWICGVTSFML